MSSPFSGQDLSPSAILYACADQFVPTGSMLTAVHIPCSEHRVKYYPLAGAMMAAAVALLVEQERARMTVVTSKKLMVFSSTNVMLERAPGVGTVGHDDYATLDDWLFTAMPASGAASAHDVVRAAYGEDMMSPPQLLIQLVSMELEHFGYLEKITSGGTGAKLLRALDLKSKWEPHCDRWGELRERASDVQALMERVKGRDPQAWELLIKQLTSGCQSRQEAQEVSGPD